MTIPPMQHLLDESSKSDLSDIVYRDDGMMDADFSDDGGFGMPGTRRLRPGKRTMIGGFLGMSFAAFALGFDACLFDLDRVDECVAHAEGWVEPFEAIGNHLIEWGIAIVTAVFS